MSERILCVDDERNVLAGFERTLRRLYDVDTASSGDEALRLIRTRGPYTVIVADMRMPGMNGVELLARARAIAPDTVRIMLTGNADQKTAVDAVNQGHVFRFLNKPCPPEVLTIALDAGIRHYRHVIAERELLEKTLNGSVRILTEILALQEPAIFGRSRKLREWMAQVATHFPQEDSWKLEMGAMLAPIGWVTLPASLVTKIRERHPLDGNESTLLERIPAIGADLLRCIPRLEPVAEIVRYSAKHFDGDGPPIGGAAGEAIPLGARILLILAELHPLVVAGAKIPRALESLRNRDGYFDPQVFDIVADCFREPETDRATPSVRSIRMDELHPGAILASDLFTLDDMMVLASGQEVTPMLLEKVRNFARLTGIREPFLVFESKPGE